MIHKVDRAPREQIKRAVLRSISNWAGERGFHRRPTESQVDFIARATGRTPEDVKAFLTTREAWTGGMQQATVKGPSDVIEAVRGTLFLRQAL
jgi:hypothetical protein